MLSFGLLKMQAVLYCFTGLDTLQMIILTGISFVLPAMTMTEPTNVMSCQESSFSLIFPKKPYSRTPYASISRSVIINTNKKVQMNMKRPRKIPIQRSEWSPLLSYLYQPANAETAKKTAPPMRMRFNHFFASSSSFNLTLFSSQDCQLKIIRNSV